jgi:hypothetical protein
MVAWGNRDHHIECGGVTACFAFGWGHKSKPREIPHPVRLVLFWPAVGNATSANADFTCNQIRLVIFPSQINMQDNHPIDYGFSPI